MEYDAALKREPTGTRIVDQILLSIVREGPLRRITRNIPIGAKITDP